MKVWMIVYAMSQPMQWFGPLPMSMAECESKAAGYQMEFRVQYPDDNIEVKCVYSAERPTVEQLTK